MPSLAQKRWFKLAFIGLTVSVSLALYILAPLPGMPGILRQLLCVLIALVLLSLPIAAYEIMAGKRRLKRHIKQ